MKSFEELCAIMRKIAKEPYAKVDYLTVGDFLQMRQHIVVCQDCDKLTEEVVEQGKKEGKLQEEGPSEN